MVVLVFDPNIMPNAVTGQSTQVVRSDLANPTGNCLNSLSAIQAAMGTKTAATANANKTQSNPVYDTFGGVQTQVLVPGVTAIAETSPANSNLFLTSTSSVRTRTISLQTGAWRGWNSPPFLFQGHQADRIIGRETPS